MINDESLALRAKRLGHERGNAYPEPQYLNRIRALGAIETWDCEPNEGPQSEPEEDDPPCFVEPDSLFDGHKFPTPPARRDLEGAGATDQRALQQPVESAGQGQPAGRVRHADGVTVPRALGSGLGLRGREARDIARRVPWRMPSPAPRKNSPQRSRNGLKVSA